MVQIPQFVKNHLRPEVYKGEGISGGVAQPGVHVSAYDSHHSHHSHHSRHSHHSSNQNTSEHLC